MPFRLDYILIDMPEWKCKTKGCAKIYTREGIDQAIVDRQGFGFNRSQITYKGVEYPSVAAAKKAAELDGKLE